MAEVGRISVVVEGKDVGLSQLIQNVQKQMGQGGKTAQDYAGAIASITPAQQRAEAKTLQFAQTLARSQVAAGETSQAILTLSTALGNVTPGTNAANTALTQLQSLLNKTSQTATAQTSSFSTFGKSLESIKTGVTSASQGISGLVSGIGALGGAFAVSQIASFAGSLIESGNELEKTQASVRALAGSQDFYNRIVQLAKERQAQFGGSLNDNIRDFGSFANLAKRTGVDIQFLTGAAARLAAIDPAQGLEGASLALKEFFSGSVNSLVTRFELPRNLLNSIKDIKDPLQQAQALDKVLNELGASQQLLDNQANTTAATYDKLKGAFADFGAVTGQVLATTLQPVVNLMSQFASAASTAIPVLINSATSVQAFGAQVLASSGSLEEANAKIAQINGQLPIFVGGLNQLTPAQFAFAQAMLQTGASATEVQASLQANGDTLNALGAVLENNRGSFEATDAQVAAFTASLGTMAASSDQGYDSAFNLANAVATGAISFAEATAQVEANAIGLSGQASQAAVAAAAQQNAAAATDQSTAAFQVNTDALVEKIAKDQEAEATSAQLAQMQATLANLGGAVASGLMTSAAAAAQLASQYNITTQAALQLVAAQAALGQAKANAAALTDQRAGERAGGSSKTSKQITDEADAARRLQRQQEALTAAQNNQIMATGTQAQKLGLVRAELAKLTPGTVDYINKQTELIRLEQQAAKGGGKKGGGGGGKASAAAKENDKLVKQEQKLDDQLLKDQTKTNQKLEENEVKHRQNLLKINQDYQKKLDEQDKANDINKRKNRADFYDSLANAADQGLDASVYASQYEAAFAEAQTIAQSGKKKLADEFLALRTEQINQLKELDAEAQSIKEDDNLSDSQKRDKLAFLEGRRKLREDAQAEELKQLQEGGDSINNEYQAQLSAEQQAYQDNANGIISEAQRTADERIAASDRATARIIENAKKETAVTGKPAIGATGQIPTNTPTPTATTAPQVVEPSSTPQPVTASAPLPITTSTPISTQPSGETLVRPVGDLLQVADSALLSSLATLTALTDSKLSEVVSTIATGTNQVIGKLASVESAIRAIRAGSNQTLVAS